MGACGWLWVGGCMWVCGVCMCSVGMWVGGVCMCSVGMWVGVRLYVGMWCVYVGGCGCGGLWLCGYECIIESPLVHKLL